MVRHVPRADPPNLHGGITSPGPPFLHRPTYGIQAAARGVQGSVWALGADDCSLGVRRVVTGQGLMMRVGGLSVRVALRRRIGASVAGDGLLAAWPSEWRGMALVNKSGAVSGNVLIHTHTTHLYIISDTAKHHSCHDYCYNYFSSG